MARTGQVLLGLLSLALLVAACSAQGTANATSQGSAQGQQEAPSSPRPIEDTPKTGSPQRNKCDRLCSDVVEASTKYSIKEKACMDQCIKCMAQLAQTRAVNRTPLSSDCEQVVELELMRPDYKYARASATALQDQLKAFLEDEEKDTDEAAKEIEEATRNALRSQSQPVVPDGRIGRFGSGARHRRLLAARPAAAPAVHGAGRTIA